MIEQSKPNAKALNLLAKRRDEGYQRVSKQNSGVQPAIVIEQEYVSPKYECVGDVLNKK